ncbi:MAG: hypothetical protein F4X81_05160 [Gammaproteobacteria bacterium]|nr:hypothetical protein [Gammaproteobacteria bacterium]MYE50836.1 hypothetical protein [Gammaproteobacteria bacterium]MYE86787.1 hypothetical protein [Gammaproteobacteria bacterium]MYF48880.1 hypothetical protein [Gammaproteobacteria bacterium]MYG12948.1 hypothetical protein [Gammaproteobacteria bacterium]
MRTALSTGKLARGFLIGAWLAVGGSLAVAAETEAENGNAEVQDEVPAEENEGANDDPTESHDVFLPTEEISEDFAVPFPVDI